MSIFPRNRMFHFSRSKPGNYPPPEKVGLCKCPNTATCGKTFKYPKVKGKGKNKTYHCRHCDARL